MQLKKNDLVSLKSAPELGSFRILWIVDCHAQITNDKNYLKLKDISELQLYIPGSENAFNPT